MSADVDFERRVGSELRSALDRTAGPHPEWASSPAAAIVAGDPAVRPRGVPWRLMAVAAVLVVGSVTALILASPDADDAGVPGCPTLADYATASTQPSPPEGEAPGVTFPPVAPTATMTTGTLQPGEWAVIANAEGPGLQLRVRDVRECGRLPDVRSGYEGGSLHLATVDARVLRDNSGLDWLGVRGFVGLSIAERPGALVPGFGVPGVDHGSRLTVPEGFAASSTVILDVPVTDKRLTLEHPTESTHTLPGLTPTAPDWPRVRWVVREGVPTGDDFVPRTFPSPGPTPTIGEIQTGVDVTFTSSDGSGVARFSEVDQVTGYPGLRPAPGNVFVEVAVHVLSLDVRVMMPRYLRAVGADGRELPILQDAYGSDQRRGVLSLLQETGSDDAWIVIEAPSSGPVRLEYHHHGPDDQSFWIQLRD